MPSRVRDHARAPRWAAAIALITLSVAQMPSLASSLDEMIPHPAIPLLDEEGNHVLDSGRPYSTRMSCGTGGCHDYDAITRAYHFETGRDEARDDFGADSGLGMLVSPGYFGGYNCMGGDTPDFLARKENASEEEFGDKGTPGLVMRCEGCHSGGGWMERDRNGRRYDEVDPESVAHLDGDYFYRTTDENGEEIITQWDWQQSGVVENDCMVCHVKFSAMKTHDPDLPADEDPYDLSDDLRRHALIDEGLFRWANTATLEFLNLNMNGDGSLRDDTQLVRFERDDLDGDGVIGVEELVRNEDGTPVIAWNEAAFDADRKAVIPMVRYPDNDACMECHRTSNSRRGFYGFGEDAAATYDEEGMLEEDYKDDVHYGRTWTEANGESRPIENCNTCHARNYFDPAYANVDLDADHNFPKGNSDMNLHDDRDYSPPSRTCRYCHDEAENPAIPSGQEDMLSAHVQRWRADQSFFGYTEESITGITRTHLDVISCEACHITNKKDRRGDEIQIMYRYARSSDGALRIRPYNPRARAFWRDRTSGRILYKVERNAVFEQRTDENGEDYGAIIHPETGQELGRVSFRISHGSPRYGNPEDYETMLALKEAYDALMRQKGYADADVVMVVSEISHYVISHNTRPAVEALQCEQCHERKENGSISALVSANGVLGEGNVRNVYTLPDPRLVEEGIVELDYPYMSVDEAGEVIENVDDILYYSALNPSLSRLNAEIAGITSGGMVGEPKEEALERVGLSVEDTALLMEKLQGSEVFLFKPAKGDPAVRASSLLAEQTPQSEATLPDYLFLIGLEEALIGRAMEQTRLQVEQVFRIEARDRSASPVTDFPGMPLYVTLPWQGSDLSALAITSSSDGGETWTTLDADQIVAAQPASGGDPGYVLFTTTHLSDFAVATGTTGTAEETTESGGGGGASGLLTLLLLPLLLAGRRRGRG